MLFTKVQGAIGVFASHKNQTDKQQKQQNELLKQIAEKLNIPANKISGGDK